MLTGRLPFSAADAMECVHCHAARLARACARPRDTRALAQTAAAEGHRRMFRTRPVTLSGHREPGASRWLVINGERVHDARHPGSPLGKRHGGPTLEARSHEAIQIHHVIDRLNVD